MKQRQITLAAVGCGAICALCVGAFLYAVRGEADAARAEVLARYGGEQVEVCVATRDVAAGERVDASAVESRLWVADLLPAGAISDSADVVGRTATSSMFKGEVVSERRFEEGQGALDIPSGQEAVSVPTKAVQAVGGAIRPGMTVDVYASGSSGTTALAKGVIVLATSVGESGSLVSGDSGWITLAVDPERVEEVISAAGKTSLYFVLPGLQAQEDAESQEVSPGNEGDGGAESSSQGSAPAEENETGEHQPDSSEVDQGEESDGQEGAAREEDGREGGEA